MRLLVTGSRTWTDRAMLFESLDELHRRVGIDVLIEGCAAGADRIAGDHVIPEDGWAKSRGVPGWHFPADWRLGRSAGVRRNSKMLADSEPEMVVAFWDGESHGTADMIRKSRTWGLEVVVVKPAEGRYEPAGAGWMPARGEPCAS